MKKTMKPTAPRLGGGGFFPYPKYVWSPSGGWWGNTKYWRRNTGFAVVTIGLISATIFAKGASIEVRYLLLGYVTSPSLPPLPSLSFIACVVSLIFLLVRL